MTEKSMLKENVLNLPFFGKITSFSFPKMGMLKIDYFNVRLMPYVL